MGFRDEKNEIVGFDIDLAKEAAKRLGVQVTFKPIDWAAKEAELNGKRIDVLWNGRRLPKSARPTSCSPSPIWKIVRSSS